jgi:hypothetical protein
MFHSPAEQAGHDAGMAVQAGQMAPEEAGSLWLTWADKSHGAGQAFLRAFDRTGAQR